MVTAGDLYPDCRMCEVFTERIFRSVHSKKAERKSAEFAREAAADRGEEAVDRQDERGGEDETRKGGRQHVQGPEGHL